MSHYFKKETVIFGNRIINAWNLPLDNIVTFPTVLALSADLPNLISCCNLVFNLLSYLYFKGTC